MAVDNVRVGEVVIKTTVFIAAKILAVPDW